MGGSRSYLKIWFGYEGGGSPAELVEMSSETVLAEKNDGTNRHGKGARF